MCLVVLLFSQFKFLKVKASLAQSVGKQLCMMILSVVPQF